MTLLTNSASDKAPPPTLAFDGDAYDDHQHSKSWPERILWSLVGVAIINWTVQLLGPASYFWPIAVLLVISGFWGLGVVIVSVLDIDTYPIARWHSGSYAWTNAALMLVLMGAFTYVQLHNSPAYGTDEIAFDQYAAELLHHGMNPYTHSLQASFGLFRLSPDMYTYTTTGAPVLSLSYPSLSFLLYMPFVLLGWTTEMANVINVAFWMISILMMFTLLPKNIRAAALLIGAVFAYTSAVNGGVTDVLYLPFLLLTAYRWDRFGENRLSYIGPIGLGLAMSVKQTPWPILLFMLIAIGMDEFDHADLGCALRRCGRYLTVVLVTFVIPNLPFIVMSPSSWFRGILVPFSKNMVPSGQGLVALTLFAHLGGGTLTGYTITMVLVAVLVVAVYVATYPLLRPATFLLAAIVYLFAARSQTNYLVEFIPVVLVGAITVGPARWPAQAVERSRKALGATGSGLARLGDLSTTALSHHGSGRGPLRSRTWGIALIAGAVLSAAAAIYTLTDSSPLSVHITGIRTNGYVTTINQLNLSVHNSGSKPLTPDYTVQSARGDSTFWYVSYGPRTIKPGTTAHIELGAPNPESEPSIGEGFSVLGFTENPSAVAVSHRFLRKLVQTTLYPSAFNTPVKVGVSTLLKVQLINNFDAPLRRAGVAVYLSQGRNQGTRTLAGTTKINGNKVSRSQIKALTNSDGVAAFHIVGTRGGKIPVTFSAHLEDEGAKYVYGSSGSVLIRFVK